MKATLANVVYAIGLAVAALQAQQTTPPTQQVQPAPEHGSITGQVISAVNGEGVRKAELLLIGKGEPYTATTDAGGFFAIRDLEPGRYQLFATRRGYSRLLYGAHGPGRRGAFLSVDPGQHVSGLVLAMSPAAVITGRVLDPYGDPAAFVMMRLLRYGGSRGSMLIVPGLPVQTNDLGEYRLYDLPPGRYLLSAMLNRRPGGGQETPSPTFYPGTANPANATPIDLKPGSLIRGVDITLVSLQPVHVRGKIVDPDLKPETIRAIELRMERTDSPAFRTFSGPGSLDAQGNFEFSGIAPGEYVLHATRREQDRIYIARQAIDAQGDVSNLVLELKPAAEVKGRLRFEGAGSDTPIEAEVDPDPPSENYAGAPVKPDGSFTLSALVPGIHYDLNINILKPEGYYVRSARLGDTDVLNDGIDVAGPAPGQVEFVAGKGSEIEGLVMNADDQPVSAATVALVPDVPLRSKRRLYEQASTDQYGRFLIRGVAPGEYKLFAWEDIADGQYQDPEFLKSCEALGQAVTIRPHAHQSAQLKVIPAAANPKPAGN